MDAGGEPASDGGAPARSDGGAGARDGAGEGSDGASPAADAGLALDAAGSDASAMTDGASPPACNGARVPGDYATVQAAFDALSAHPGGFTICLGAQAYPENVSASVQVPVTLQGMGATSTKLGSLSLTCASTCTVQGIAMQSFTANAFNGATGSVSVIGCKLGPFVPGSGASSVPLTAEANESNLTVTVDRCDISSGSTSSNAVEVMGAADYAHTLSVTLENSFVHDSADGVSCDGRFSTMELFQLHVVNDTFARNQHAIRFDAVGAHYFNDLFVNNQIAVSLYDESSVDHGNNALYGNVTNYEGIAVDGTGYVKVDPMLDGATPPGLLAGSPCRGAADPAHAPSHDYWGAPRAGAIDIGAVQSP